MTPEQMRERAAKIARFYTSKAVLEIDDFWVKNRKPSELYAAAVLETAQLIEQEILAIPIAPPSPDPSASALFDIVAEIFNSTRGRSALNPTSNRSDENLSAATTSLPGTEGKKDRAIRLHLEHVVALVNDGFKKEALAVLEANEDKAAEKSASVLKLALEALEPFANEAAHLEKCEPERPYWAVLHSGAGFSRWNSQKLRVKHFRATRAARTTIRKIIGE